MELGKNIWDPHWPIFNTRYGDSAYLTVKFHLNLIHTFVYAGTFRPLHDQVFWHGPCYASAGGSGSAERV